MFLRSHLLKVGTALTLLFSLIAANAGLKLQAKPLHQDKPPFCPPFISFLTERIIGDTTEKPTAELAPTAEAALPDFCHVMAVLSGSNEVPKAGDDDGKGMFLGYYDTRTGKFCYEMDVANIVAATAAHIHLGDLGEPGDVVIPLTQPNAKGTVAACLPVNAENNDLINKVLNNPTGFYVNVHNKDFPGGAIRGQLIGAAKLDGAKEVPGPGDSRGYGVGAVVVETKTDDHELRLCSALFVRSIQLPATAAHIHQGAQGEAGEVFIPVGAPDSTGQSIDCFEGDSEENLDKIKALLGEPSKYYFNVHNDKFPKGAIRSEQLTAVPDRMHLAGLD